MSIAKYSTETHKEYICLNPHVYVRNISISLIATALIRSIHVTRKTNHDLYKYIKLHLIIEKQLKEMFALNG